MPGTWVFSPQSDPYESTYGEWGADWWQWVFSIPSRENPLLDSNGADCDEGQSGPVWFLAGTIGGDPVTRSCRVTMDKGGRETGLLDAPQISNDAFRDALREAITTAHVFAELTDRDKADYLLSAVIVGLEQPPFGLTVRMEVGWTLTRRSSGEIVWRQALISTNSAHFVDGIKGATEGAAQENIRQAMERISRLDLGSS